MQNRASRPGTPGFPASQRLSENLNGIKWTAKGGRDGRGVGVAAPEEARGEKKAALRCADPGTGPPVHERDLPGGYRALVRSCPVAYRVGVFGAGCD